MNGGALVRAILTGVLGSRRKGARSATRYLTGSHGGRWLHAGMLLGAAGVAWGVVDTLQRRGARGGTVRPNPTDPPPIPVSIPPAGPGGIDGEALRIIRLVVSAAHADGVVNEQERAAILQQATASGMADVAARELGAPRPLPEIVAGVTSPEERATLYVLAFTILRADEQVTGSERIYLAQLADLLRLDGPTVEALESDTGGRIDALGDQGQLGG